MTISPGPAWLHGRPPGSDADSAVVPVTVHDSRVPVDDGDSGDSGDSGGSE